jgi:hypothetical protein
MLCENRYRQEKHKITDLEVITGKTEYTFIPPNQNHSLIKGKGKGKGKGKVVSVL